MIPASELVYRVAETTGLPYSTVYSVKRRFVEASVWPSSRGATVPGLGSYHLVMMLLALMADVPAKDAVASASAYYSLADPDGTKLGDFLVDIIDNFKNREPLGLATVGYKGRLELDCGQPRACFSTACNDEVQVEKLFGLQSAQWSDIRVRRSITISGKVLFDLANGLHFNRWPGDEDIAA